MVILRIFALYNHPDSQLYPGRPGRLRFPGPIFTFCRPFGNTFCYFLFAPSLKQTFVSYKMYFVLQDRLRSPRFPRRCTRRCSPRTLSWRRRSRRGRTRSPRSAWCTLCTWRALSGSSPPSTCWEWRAFLIAVIRCRFRGCWKQKKMRNH